MWDLAGILEAIRTAIAEREDALRLEQAPHGLDSWPELAFHPLIAAAARSRGLGVFAEVPYPPTAPQQATPALLRRDRLRCDLVLTPAPDLPPLDAAGEARRLREAQATLFAARARAEAPRGSPPEECLWLEVKVTGQFTYVDKVPRPNRAYTSELLATAAIDIPKLAGSPQIRRGGGGGGGGGGALLVILFTDTRATAEHDLAQLARRAVERGLPIGLPLVKGEGEGDGSGGVRIVDRVGNGWCQLALIEADGADGGGGEMARVGGEG
jgi:hypothetical protein